MVRIDDIMEPVKGAPGVQYLIDRTLLCPRDVIAFFNECILRAESNARITRHMVQAAEPEYSRARLRALADEWMSFEPLVAQMAELFRGRRGNLRLREFSDGYVTDFCHAFCLKQWNMDSPAVDVAKRHCENPAQVTYREVLRYFVNTLYKVGVIGVKPAAEVEWQWSAGGRPGIDDLELDDNCGVRVHKAFWCALNITSGRATGQDDE